MSNTVKYFHSGMPGAPQLSGTAGALLAVLEACLVTGFALRSVASLTIAGNVATMALSAGHSFEPGTVALIEGATVTGGTVNGEWEVTEATQTAVKFVTVGLTDQVASGTITAKLAGAGWVKEFVSGSKAVFKSSDLTALGMLLRVDDSTARFARVVAYEAMTTVDGGTGAFPTETMQAGGLYWLKSRFASAAVTNWQLVGDGKLLYLMTDHYMVTSDPQNNLYAFGDFIPTKSGDAFASILSGSPTDGADTNPQIPHNLWASSDLATGPFFCPRAYISVGSASRLRRSFSTIIPASIVISGGLDQVSGNHPTYPNATDGGLYLTPLYYSDSSFAVVRGVSPGLWPCPQGVVYSAFANKDTVTGVSTLTGRTLKAFTCGPNGSRGIFFIDITGPWR